jgi:hypothetical protein
MVGGTPGVAFFDAVAELAATRNLCGYWRLGEGASPFADTSGHAYGAADAVKVSTGTAMTDSVTGALPPGDDDGAVRFNNTAGGAGDFLDCPDPNGPSPGDRRFNFSGAADMTVAAWVKPAASSSTFNGTAIAVWSSGSFGPCGWGLGVTWPARTPFFRRRENGTPAADATVDGSALTADEWAFVAGTYSSVNGHTLYVNGPPAANDPATFASLPSFNFGPNIGRSEFSTESFYGAVDEITVWGGVLTAAEIMALYTAGVTGGVPPAGYVWTADGEGGAAWQPLP